MSPRYVLEVTDLVKIFSPRSKPFTAVDHISFGLKPGEILGLLGPNGAGKTTTIQMLLGILTPTQGKVSYFGEDIFTNPEPILEQINFSSTYTNLPWRLKVGETLKYTSYLYDIKDRAGRVAKIIDLFRLSPLVNKEIASLSAGQLTRVNLAKAFLNFPRVLLLDEPTASLDPETASYIRKFIMLQRDKFKVSILFTSHNMQEVSDICDRVIFIKNGKIVAEDKPENLPKIIKFSKLELVMVDGLKRTLELTGKLNLKHQVKKRAIEIEIEETQIAHFLNELAKKGIEYDQIAIKKPDLEDFFLEIVRRKQ